MMGEWLQQDSVNKVYKPGLREGGIDGYNAFDLTLANLFNKLWGDTDDLYINSAYESGDEDATIYFNGTSQSFKWDYGKDLFLISRGLQTEYTETADTSSLWCWRSEYRSTNGTAASKAFGQSTSSHTAIVGDVIKTGDGSGHSFVVWSQLGDAGPTGFNEFGGYQGTIIVDKNAFGESPASPTGKHYCVFGEWQIYAHEPDNGETNRHIGLNLQLQRVSSTDTILNNYIGIQISELNLALPSKSTIHNKWDKAIRLVGAFDYGIKLDDWKDANSSILECLVTGEGNSRFYIRSDGAIFYGTGGVAPTNYFFFDSGNDKFSMSNDLEVGGYLYATGYIHTNGSLIIAGDIGSGEAGTVRLTNAIAAADANSPSHINTPTGISGTQAGWLKIYIGTSVAYVPYWTA